MRLRTIGVPEHNSYPFFFFFFRDTLLGMWFGRRLYDWVFASHPLIAQGIEGTLEFLYDVIASPASGHHVDVFVVPLAISETVTLSVSVTLIGAWIIFAITVARNKWVKKLPLARRLTLVVVAAFAAYGLTNLYARWTFNKYLAKHPPNSERAPTTVDDKMAAKELFKK